MPKEREDGLVARGGEHVMRGLELPVPPPTLGGGGAGD